MRIGKQGYESGQINAKVIDEIETRNQEIQNSKLPSAEDVLGELE